MAIVIYECDTCKRTIELERNVQGLETLPRCKITHGCRGILHQLKVLQDFTRGRIPPDVPGLDNWKQRKVLYTHNQIVERTQWTITHNLGTYPAITVLVNRPIEDNPDNQEEITPTDINIVDKNTLILTFDRAWSGVAQLIARSSDPNLLHPADDVVSVPETSAQLTTQGELTIATSLENSPPVIEIQVEYTTTSSKVSVTYSIDDQPSLLSPWVDYDKVTIRGRIYTVRSFNIIVPQMALGTITNGSTISFINIKDASGSFRTIKREEMLILLASSPYSTYDKILDRYIDVASSTVQSNPFSIFFDSGELFAQPQAVNPVYPLIQQTV